MNYLLILTYLIVNIKGVDYMCNNNNNNTCESCIADILKVILLLQQNLYWIEIIIDFIFDIFQKLKNNKYRLLINADNDFNNLDDSFKFSCYYCFIPLIYLIIIHIIK